MEATILRTPAKGEEVYAKLWIPVIQDAPEMVVHYRNELGDICGWVELDDMLFELLYGRSVAYAWLTYDEPTDTVNIERWIHEEDWPGW